MDPDQGQEPLLPFHLQDNPSDPYNGRPLSSQASYYPQEQHPQLSEEGVFSNQGQLLSPIDQQQRQQQQYSNYLASDLHKAHPTPQQQQQQHHHQQMQQHHHQQMQQHLQQQQQMQELGPSMGSLHHHQQQQQQAGHHHFQSPQQQQQQHGYYHRRHQHDPHQHDQQRQDDLRPQQRHLLPHQPMYSSTPSLEQHQHSQLYMQPHQQPHQISDPAAADPSTPASTAASTMTSGSAASTPLLPSTTSLLSPVAFHVPPLSQNQGQGQNMGSNLASPPSEPQPGAGVQPLGMHALSWTTTPATPEQLPNAQDVAQSKRQQQTFLGSDAQAHAHDHAHDSAPAHAHGHGHHPLTPLPPPLSTTLAPAHGHPPSQHPQQQLSARDSPSSPSQAQLLSQHAQDQHHHQQQQQSQMWVGMNSDSAFHSPEGVLGQQQQQQQPQQQVRPSMKQSRSFGMETIEHQNQSYPPGYTDHQGMATAMQRHRVQSARQVFARNIMDYTDEYSLGQGQGHPHHQQHQHQQQQHSPGTPLTPQPHGGLPTLVELPLLPSSQLLQQDAQGFAAMSMSMMHQKTMSSPASLGPMAMGFNGDGSHPSMMGAHSQDYTSPTDVASYPMPLHHDNQHHRPISSRPPSRNAHGAAAGGGAGSIRLAPSNTLHRTSSAGPGTGAIPVRPSRRLRTSSMNAVPTSSFGSRSLLSSITSSLGATSLTFPEYPTSSSSPIPLTSIQAAQQGTGGGGGIHDRDGGGGIPTIAIGLDPHNDLTSPTPGGLDYARYSRSDGSSSMGNLGGGSHRFGNRISTAAGAASMSRSSPSGLSISTSSSSSSSLQFPSSFGASSSAAGASSASSSSSSIKPTPTLSNFMANHMNRKQTAIRNFACSFPGCTKAYTQLHNLKSHERTGHMPVTKPKPFLCIIPGCPKAFSQRKSLAIHIKANHKEYRYKPFKCGQAGCPKAYTQLHNLRTHEKTVHSLDLSRKRIRIPTPPRTSGGGGSGVRSMGGHPYQPQDPASGGGGGMDYGARGLSQSQRDMGLSYGHEANDEDDEEEEEEDGEGGEEDNEDPADGDWREDEGDGGQYGGPR